SEASALGLRRVVRLKVAGGFHSPIMEPAAETLSKALTDIAFHPHAFPIWANATARPIPPGRERSILADQVVSPVLFSQTVQGMASAGVDLFVHVGPGDVTAGMARRAAPGSRVVAVSDLGEIATAVEAIGTIPERS
ncbi:MAG: ACP S-malonyltransferase, partial [Acidimicrobiia bacterium]